MSKPELPAEYGRILDSVLHGSRRYWLTVGFLAAVVFWGFLAWIWQCRWGLGETGMNQPVLWGFYITNFVFFIGISHAGTLISAILRVAGAEWRRPITRAAEVITVIALCIGATQVILDLGRPDRVLNVILYGRFSSPILWDITSITVYLLSSIFYLYLPLIPDVALMRDRLTDAPRWRRRLYTFLAAGWQNTPEQRRRLEKAIGIMAIAIIPIAVSVHTVVSWIFSMTLRPMWHSTIFGPYFVVGAIYSGIAALILALAIIRKTCRLENVLKEVHMRGLGALLLVMNCLWFYFTFAEYLTTGYGGIREEMTVFAAKLTGEFGIYFWGMVGCMIVSFVLLASKRTRGLPGMIVASVLINIGMWLERFTIVVPTDSRPLLEGLAQGIYHPSWVEWSLTAASFAAFIMFYMLFARLFPLISVWETQEAEESLVEVTETLRGYLPEVGTAA